MSEELQCQIIDGVARLTLLRPRRRNAVSEALLLEFIEGMGGFARNDLVKVIVLRSGVPGIFSAGADLQTMSDPGPAALAKQFEILLDCLEAFRAVNKPIVTVVEGDCLGVGCALAAVSDVVVAAEAARFALPEIGLNLAPVIAMAALAPVVSMRQLYYWAATGRHISSTAAQSAGLVSLVVPGAALQSEVESIVAELKKAQSSAHGYVKRTARDLTPEAPMAVDRARLIQSMIAAATEPAAVDAIHQFFARKSKSQNSS